MQKSLWMLGALSGLLAVGCSGTEGAQFKDSVTGSDLQPGVLVVDEDEDGDEGDEESVSLSQVPEAAKKAVKAAVPGIVLEEAELEGEEGGVALYCVHGTANGVFHEVEVTADGKVIAIEEGEEEEED